MENYDNEEMGINVSNPKKPLSRELPSMRKPFTIKDLAEGKCAVEHNGNLEQLNNILKLAFPESYSSTSGVLRYYFINNFELKLWDSSDETDLPTQSVSDFILPIFTIQDFVEGRCAILNDGNLEQLRKVLKVAFPKDKDVTAGKSLYYYRCPTVNKIWNSGDFTYLPIQSIKDFFETGIDRTITPEKAKEIIKIACKDWRLKLLKIWANNIALDENIEISEEFYSSMRKASTLEQNCFLDTIFGKDKPVIDFDKLKTGSIVKIELTKQEIKFPNHLDLDEPFDIVLLNSAYIILGSEFTQGDYEKQITLHQNGLFCCFRSDKNMDFITEVIEY